MTTTNIYILRLQGGNYYIGKSDDPMKRYDEHLRGQGSAWTKLHKPISCERVILNASAFDEDKYTKEYMAKYGIDKVRGGTYVERDLSQEQVDSLQKEIWAAQDKCTRCGHQGHFVDACFATKDANGTEIEDVEYVWPCEKCDKEFTSKSICEAHEKNCRGRNTYIATNTATCFRCGRKGHYATTCYVESESDSEEYSAPPKKSSSCYKCGRAGHYASNCYANTYKKTYSRYSKYNYDFDSD
jgi:predicted GIY-YIG superfamily endonuclease